MARNPLYTHPEIEFNALKSAYGTLETTNCTLLDLLEIYPDDGHESIWKPGLDHAGLMSHFSEVSSFSLSSLWILIHTETRSKLWQTTAIEDLVCRVAS